MVAVARAGAARLVEVDDLTVGTDGLRGTGTVDGMEVEADLTGRAAAEAAVGRVSVLTRAVVVVVGGLVTVA